MGARERLLGVWLLSFVNIGAMFSSHPVPHKRVQSTLSSEHSNHEEFQSNLRLSKGLDVLNNTSYFLLSEEARYVRAIRACGSSPQVQAVLDRAPDPWSPNMAATALRTMVKFDRNSQATSKALPALLNVTKLGVVAYQSGDKATMTIYALQDVLYSLSLLQRDDLWPLASIIWDILASDLSIVLEKLEPRRLVEIMESAHTLSLQKGDNALLDAIAARLWKTDAVGKLTPQKICEALLPLASYPDTVKRFLRRLRKHDVRSELTPYHITVAVRAAKVIQSKNPHLSQEVNTMAFTLVNRELTRPILGNTTTLANQLSSHQASLMLNAISKLGWKEIPAVVMDLYSLISRASPEGIAPADLAMTLHSMESIDVLPIEQRIHVATQLGNILVAWLKEGRVVTLRHINLIFLTVFRQFGDNSVVLGIFETALKTFLQNEVYCSLLQDEASEFDVALYTWFLSEACAERDPQIGRDLGNVLLRIATTSRTMDPASFVMSLRYAVKAYSRADAAQEILQPFLQAASKACTGEFLQHLKLLDLSFLVEALVIAKCSSEDLFWRLGKAAIQLQSEEECSSSSARRIISSYATVVPRIPSTRLQECQRQMFDLLGATLLTTQLLPYEAAESAFAYAKAGYVTDMGVFDHVTDLVGLSLDSLSTKQVAKCLWACARMYSWEQSMEGGQAPPYLSTAKAFAKHLSTRQSELSARDLAQSLWAMGRLDISDSATSKAFATRAKCVLSSCFACETANIVWGLSKIGFTDEDILVSISRRMLDPDIVASPEEAACVLYALGNAGIREDEVFEYLTEVMMSKVEFVGAQAMANALWAHNVVGKLPPPALLQSWASEKLGLVGFVPIHPDFK